MIYFRSQTSASIFRSLKKCYQAWKLGRLVGTLSDLTVLLLKCHVTSSYSLLNVFLLSPNPLGWKCQNTTFLIWAFTDLCLIFLASDICLHKHENIEALSEYPPLISKLKVLDEDILFFSGHTWIMFLEHFILFTKTRKGGRFVFGILSFQTELCSGEFELYLLLLSISVTWKHSRRRSI